MARTEVRKECPSCGLGVPLDAKVCEFCGWDFEEEDEWISQIEQLEQELISEKHKTDDASMDKMIKSTIRSPIIEKPSAPEKAPTVTIRKKGSPSAKPQIQTKAAEPARESQAEERDFARPPEKPTTVAPAKSRTKISVKIGADRGLPPPPEELEEKTAPAQPAATLPAKSVMTVPEKPAEPSPGKKVRRVVSKPAGGKPAVPATSPRKETPAPIAPVKSTTTVKPASTIPATQKAPPAAAPAAKAKTAAPSKPATRTAPPEEKKGLFGGFGKMFSMETKSEKTTSRPAPSKITPTKSTPPSKQKPPTAPEKPTVRVFVCPLCNSEVSEDATTCPKCGAEFA